MRKKRLHAFCYRPVMDHVTEQKLGALQKLIAHRKRAADVS